MEIVVVDKRNFVGGVASALRIGEIPITSTQDMVTKVLKKVGGNYISKLTIMDHGAPSYIEIGSDHINISTIYLYSSVLALLQPKFEAGAVVHFQHCQIGMNKKILIEFSRIFGVPVIAGTGNHNPWFRFNWGHYNQANPNGTFKKNVGRP